MPAGDVYLPAIMTRDVYRVEPNDTFENAIYLPDGFRFVQDFAGQNDFFDVYKFPVQTGGTYEIQVTSIPPGHDYDVYLYAADKFWITQATRVGDQPEFIVVPLEPGVYYVMVVRVFGQPTTDPYEIVVFRQ